MVAASPTPRRTSTRRRSRDRLSRGHSRRPGRVEQVRRLRALELPAQPVHVHVDDVRAGVELVAPDQTQDLLAREHLAAARHQAGEELELLGGQVERAISAAGQPASGSTRGHPRGSARRARSAAAAARAPARPAR